MSTIKSDRSLLDKIKLGFTLVLLPLKTAIAFIIPVIFSWFCIPLFQTLGMQLDGSPFQILLVPAFWLTAVLGSVSMGALLGWAMLGINPFKGFENEELKNPFDVVTYVQSVQPRQRRQQEEE